MLQRSSLAQSVPRPFSSCAPGRCALLRSVHGSVPRRLLVATDQAPLPAALGRGNYGSPNGHHMPFQSDGRVINRAINKELSQAKNVEDLKHVLLVNYSDMDDINISTAWVKLAKLRGAMVPRSARSLLSGEEREAQNALVHKLLSKTMATVHTAPLRILAGNMWSMAKLSIDLRTTENGHYFAEMVEQRLLVLIDEMPTINELDGPHIWLGMTIYPFSESLQRRLLDVTLQSLAEWGPQAICQVCHFWGHKLVKLKPRDCAVLAKHVARSIDLQADTVEGYERVELVITGSHFLGLKLPPAMLKQLHDMLLTMPDSLRRALRSNQLNNYSLYLAWAVELGHQPTADEATLWEAKLMALHNGSRQSLIHVAVVLSMMAAYKPSKDMLDGIQMCIGSTSGYTPADAKRLLLITKYWRPSVPEKQMVNLRQLAGMADS